MENTVLISRLSEIAKREEEEYRRKTGRSKELWERARKVLPGGVTYAIRFFRPYPLFIKSAKGTRVYDVDGNEYIDFWEGHGTHLLGHLPEQVIEAVNEALKKGSHLGYENPYALEYAEFLTKLLPGIEMIRFSNSGTEANLYAVRAARAYTGKNYIVKMEGGWHGGVESLHKATSSPPFDLPESAGLPQDFTKFTIAVPYNDIEAVERALRSYPTAAVIVEPVLGGGGCIGPDEGYLKELRRLTLEHGTLLIFDEVITGFRLSPGGGQEFFGVKADMVIYGKAVGGGMPGAGAIGGRREIMEMMDHIKFPDRARRAFHGGTFTGNPITIHAGRALVEYLSSHREIYQHANSAWEDLRRKAEKICSSYGVECFSTGAGTMTGIHFTRKRPRNTGEAYELRWSGGLAERALNLHARNNGVLYLGEGMAHLLPALVHDDSELKSFMDAMESLLSEATRR
ncbi:MAG: aspartate aminotransferase family protein [Fervidicoccaceae archaeon]